MAKFVKLTGSRIPINCSRRILVVGWAAYLLPPVVILAAMWASKSVLSTFTPVVHALLAAALSFPAVVAILVAAYNFRFVWSKIEMVGGALTGFLSASTGLSLVATSASVIEIACGPWWVLFQLTATTVLTIGLIRYNFRAAREARPSWRSAMAVGLHRRFATNFALAG
ncbi:hypothetical protein QNM97_17255 [Gordonia sp. L191]|uniref:hypothetical protein n=1 Tax=Gordonia sp. L191 TaxID=2982699 RepID=UPI0024C02A38|nr:hypothetical protein [Gordonia sp. L191]WHU45757.1 hypothetical protein QNM97_17255 [Gordonia sp. L191]